MRYCKKIAGERIYLSPVSKEDEEVYVKWMNDGAVAKNFGQYSRLVTSKNELKWLFEPDSDMHRYAIVLLNGDEMIGSVSLHNIDHLNRNAFIGIFIGEETRRGKGYGTESVRLILDFGFRTMNLHTIMLTVHSDNLGAIACYQKVGFREAGRLPEWVFKDGRYVDKLYMGILAREFTRP
jgi:RimJ/RimL family protein N-acetyltransferase